MDVREELEGRRMDVSIIIVNYKTPDLVIDCVNSIQKWTENVTYEIIVVDNASKDGSVERLKKELGEKIAIIESDINLGFGKANNLGVKSAKGEYVFLLNSDTLLVSNAVKILFDYITHSQEVGIVGGNLYSVDMKENSSFSLFFDDVQMLKKQSGWMYILAEIGLRCFRQKFYTEEQKRRHAYKNTFNYAKEPIEVGYIFGTDMMLSKQLYDHMQGFDPDFFMYAEEEELSWRIHNAGYKIVNVPMAQIVHLDGGTFKRDDSFNARQFSMRMNGAMTYYKKRYGMEGVQKFYFYKNLRLERQYAIAKKMKRSKLLKLTQKQKDCLQEQYKRITDENRTS